MGSRVANSGSISTERRGSQFAERMFPLAICEIHVAYAVGAAVGYTNSQVASPVSESRLDVQAPAKKEKHQFLAHILGPRSHYDSGDRVPRLGGRCRDRIVTLEAPTRKGWVRWSRPPYAARRRNSPISFISTGQAQRKPGGATGQVKSARRGTRSRTPISAACRRFGS